MSQVPDHAAIHSTVDLAKHILNGGRGEASIKFLNAILRAAQRQPEVLLTPAGLATAETSQALAQVSGAPDWWLVQLQTAYGIESSRAMLALLESPPVLGIRVNTLKVSPADYAARLQAEAIKFQTPDTDLPEALVLPEYTGSPRHLPGFAEGWVYVQNPSSAAVAVSVDVAPDHRVLDLCAAPGSKTTHLAARMGNQGHILAMDSQAVRLGLLQENLKRLSVTNVEILEADALSWEPEASFDRVLVDAPCSGTGTLRRNPEILLQLLPADLEAYAQKQSALLAKGFDALRPGGRLVYSTCSLEAAENGAVVEAFLPTRPDAVLRSERQRPIDAVADGFYVAVIEKAGG